MWNGNIGDSEMAHLSSTVVVGRVEAMRFVGPVLTATDDLGNCGEWQLIRVTTNIENVLKGSAVPGNTEFYFYTWLGGITGDVNSLNPNRRYVFFLTKADGVLRAVRDFGRSSIEVGSGRHRPEQDGGSGSIEERIAALLLMPGEDLHPQTYRRLLNVAVPRAIEWLGPCKTARILWSVALTRETSIQESVRQQLSSYFGHDDPCSAGQ